MGKTKRTFTKYFNNNIKFLEKAALLSILLCPIVWGVYEFSGLSFVITNISTLATVSGAFSFTMMGFLAAMAAILLSVKDRRKHREWARKYSKFFIILYSVSLLSLFITFFGSIAVYIVGYQNFALKLVLSMLVTNFIQVSLCTVVVIRQAVSAD
ncbi:hypothetical protein CWC31_02590 [Pseudoalteromonas ruthenica]|uniref:hypothetical protein n=1 Tax=Pseudoalteromonas ruthenica TaxID=151081 RepID=UPI0011088BB1|nr:hypothetical protein [Pseudoalteromonas ruthenica]TLX52056.1 hypothetical protein CWC31_02590 [Pseudoalteromonas ruthenica]